MHGRNKDNDEIAEDGANDEDVNDGAECNDDKAC